MPRQLERAHGAAKLDLINEAILVLVPFGEVVLYFAKTVSLRIVERLHHVLKGRRGEGDGRHELGSAALQAASASIGSIDGRGLQLKF